MNNTYVSMADVDRISELPEPLRHHVLSFLPQKQAIQTSALSKTWRHVGPTRPKIELRQTHFEWIGGGRGGKPKLLSVLADTIQTYHRRNLPVHEFILEISPPPPPPRPPAAKHQSIDRESKSALDKHVPTLLTAFRVQRLDFSVPLYSLSPSLVFRAEFLVELRLGEVNFTTNNGLLDQPLFKNLKRLSLHKVRVYDKTLESIIRTCPLIEHLLISSCLGTKSINLTAFPAESRLEELRLRGIKIITSSAELLPIKRLKILALDEVVVSDESLDTIVASCPSIERLRLSNCVTLTVVRLDGLTKIRTVEIRGSNNTLLNWYHQEKHFFPRLKTLRLNSIGLSRDFFESFTSIFPSLEALDLNNCFGFSEIRLTVCSVKRLAITDDKPERLTITIYAPSIRFLHLSVISPPQLSFYTEGMTEWKSKVVMLDRDWSEDRGSIFPWLVNLRELLASLSESKIWLDVSSDPFEKLRMEDSNDPGFSEPVTIERVRVRGSGGRVFSSFSYIVNSLFLVCRPRYIHMKWYYSVGLKAGEEGKNKLVEYIVFEIVGNRGGRSRAYFWDRDLEEISMEVWDEKSRRWNTSVPVEGNSITASSDIEIRFPVKWREEIS